MKTLFKEDLRWLAGLSLACAMALISLSLFGLVSDEDRRYPALTSPFFLLIAVGFLHSRRVDIDEKSQQVVETTSNWKFWTSTARKVPFDQCESVIIGRPTTSGKGPRFRRVWLELSEGDPILLTTIPRAVLGKAREAGQKMGSALDIEVKETRRTYPGDSKGTTCRN